MIAATQWVMLVYFGYTSQVLGAYPTEADCMRAMQVVASQSRALGMSAKGFCLPVGEVVESK